MPWCCGCASGPSAGIEANWKFPLWPWGPVPAGAVAALLLRRLPAPPLDTGTVAAAARSGATIVELDFEDRWGRRWDGCDGHERPAPMDSSPGSGDESLVESRRGWSFPAGRARDRSRTALGTDTAGTGPGGARCRHRRCRTVSCRAPAKRAIRDVATGEVATVQAATVEDQCLSGVSRQGEPEPAGSRSPPGRLPRDHDRAADDRSLRSAEGEPDRLGRAPRSRVAGRRCPRG